MKEFDDLINYCFEKYTEEKCNDCNNNLFCTENGCSKGDCTQCLHHIMHTRKPDFHYPCNRSTYFYVLRFFNRFASEIRRFYDHAHPKSQCYYFVSLGCGPGSELYGIVDGLRHCLNDEFSMIFRGYDTSFVWNDIQKFSENCFSGTNCDVRFYNCDMFNDWQDKDDCKIDVLILNYLLSDVQKYAQDNEELKQFLQQIVNFIVQHKINYIMFNDINFYGYGALDSGVKCMEYISQELVRFTKKTNVVKILYKNDGYIPLNWYCWENTDLLFKLDEEKTIVADPWRKCASKYIFTKIYWE